MQRVSSFGRWQMHKRPFLPSSALELLKHVRNNKSLTPHSSTARTAPGSMRYLPVGQDAISPPPSATTGCQSLETASSTQSSASGPTPLPCNVPPNESTPQGDTRMFAPYELVGPAYLSEEPDPSARSVHPMLVDAEDAFPRRQRSDNTPVVPIPPEM